MKKIVLIIIILLVFSCSNNIDVNKSFIHHTDENHSILFIEKDEELILLDENYKMINDPEIISKIEQFIINTQGVDWKGKATIIINNTSNNSDRVQCPLPFCQGSDYQLKRSYYHTVIDNNNDAWRCYVKIYYIYCSGCGRYLDDVEWHSLGSQSWH